MPVKHHVLGLNGYHAPTGGYGSEWSTKWYHDASAVLVTDGVVEATVEEERLTRRKHTGTFPSRAIRFCLEHAGLRLADVDCIAVGELGGAADYQDPDLSAAAVARTLRSLGLCSSDVTKKVRLVEHHVAHAMSAYYPSGFDDARPRRRPRGVPHTCRVLESLEPYLSPAGQVALHNLVPGARLRPHADGPNTTLTCHLGLVVPERCVLRVAGESRTWEEAKCLWFDHSFVHDAWNASDRDRCILLLDVIHPDLTVAEVEAWRAMYAQSRGRR